MKKNEKLNPNEVELSFIVNGSLTEVIANLNQPLKVAVASALRESGNGGRDIDDWQVKVDGLALDVNEKVEKLNLLPGVEIFISLNAGQGG